MEVSRAWLKSLNERFARMHIYELRVVSKVLNDELKRREAQLREKELKKHYEI